MKLKGRKNYPAWAQQVQYHLREVRVWDIVRGQELALELVDKVDGKDVVVCVNALPVKRHLFV
jgi:hypothetical protein